jgi:hypothetical protein
LVTKGAALPDQCLHSAECGDREEVRVFDFRRRYLVFNPNDTVWRRRLHVLLKDHDLTALDGEDVREVALDGAPVA